MYLAIYVGKFNFAISVEAILRIVEAKSIIKKGDAFYSGNTEVIPIKLEEVLGVREVSKTYCEKAILFNTKIGVISALLVDDVKEVIREEKGHLLQKLDFLDLYGFTPIKGFILTNGKLLFLLDEDYLQKSIEANLWQS